MSRVMDVVTPAQQRLALKVHEAEEVRFHKLSGIEIRATRIAASRCSLPTNRRLRKMRQPLPHVGKKQQARHLFQKRAEGGAV